MILKYNVQMNFVNEKEDQRIILFTTRIAKNIQFLTDYNNNKSFMKKIINH